MNNGTYNLRLLINKFTEDNLEAWFRIESNFEVRKYIYHRILNLDKAQSYIRNSIQSYINNGYSRYGIRDKTNNKSLGMCGFLFDGIEIDFYYRYFSVPGVIVLVVRPLI